jgi:hypothetical protein
MSGIWPGDEFVADSGRRYKIVALVAYQGREDCQDSRCTRRGWGIREDGSFDYGECAGWHCSLCDAPCSSQGHFGCPRSQEREQ